MANVIDCPVCAGTGVEDADGWSCPDCAGRGSIIVNDVAFADDEEEEDAFVVSQPDTATWPAVAKKPGEQSGASPR